MFCMNERKALVYIEQVHGEYMIILKLGINISVTWNCLCSCVEGKDVEVVM